ncbi:MAG TPA: hypothetical protein VML55_20135 [Planctomycetaceae bacterium]|nr:hypothetical protein [Planctomycetaceae bacterium]
MLDGSRPKGRFLDGQPILARRTSPRERLWLWCRRHPGVAALAGVIALLLVVIALGSLAAAVRLNEQRDAAVESLARATTAEAGARRSEGDARSSEVRSVAARRLADHSLHDALLAQGRLGTDGTRSGRRFDGLAALAQAAQLADQLQLGPGAAAGAAQRRSGLHGAGRYPHGTRVADRSCRLEPPHRLRRRPGTLRLRHRRGAAVLGSAAMPSNARLEGSGTGAT